MRGPQACEMLRDTAAHRRQSSRAAHGSLTTHLALALGRSARRATGMGTRRQPGHRHVLRLAGAYAPGGRSSDASPLQIGVDSRPTMKLLVQIPAGFLLLLWPMAVMMSPMAFGAPGSTSNRSILLPLVSIVFYPVLIGVTFFVLNWSFLFFSPRVFLLLSIALPVSAFLLFGYPRIVFNMYRGVGSDGYFAKPNAVYFRGVALDGADPRSFVIDEVDSAYARDRAHVYYLGEPVSGADAASFAAVGGNAPSTAYRRDHKRVFYLGKAVAAADPETFRALEDSAYAQDRAHVFYQGELVRGADAATFVLLDAAFARDKTGLYFLGTAILPGVDIGSFELLPGASFARDKHKVYALPSGSFASAHEVPGADRATFTPLSRAYAKDVNHVYYPVDQRAAAIPNADAATFTVSEWDEASGSEAHDKRHFYLQGKVVGSRVN
jgi:hypothetical protein